MQQPDLSLTQVILLDRIQKGLPISRDEHQQLKKQRLVEGRFPNLIVSASVAKATGDTAYKTESKHPILQTESNTRESYIEEFAVL